jgi:hypothetical protein
MSATHFYLVLPHFLIPSAFPTISQDFYPVFPIRATFLAHLILFDLIILPLLSQYYPPAPCCETAVVYIRFEVFTAVTMKNAVFWDITPFGSCKNR